jgi:methylated-DNA-[protein]-cysteine S-methyltransferase
VRAQFTTYAVPGWGVGELWTGEAVVLAHEFRFGAEPDASAQPVATPRDVRAAPGDVRAARDVGAAPSQIRAAPRTSRAASPKGVQGPLSSTVPTTSARVGNGFVSTSQQQQPASEPSTPASPSDSRVDPAALADRFTAFFAGEDADFRDVPIDLDWATPFQRALVDALRAVPRGAVVSYGELAALAGRPGAARAAGSFCSHNRFMLIVPCHRVVGAAGLGGYGSAGLDTKRRLLALEGVEL